METFFIIETGTLRYHLNYIVLLFSWHVKAWVWPRPRSFQSGLLGLSAASPRWLMSGRTSLKGSWPPGMACNRRVNSEAMLLLFNLNFDQQNRRSGSHVKIWVQWWERSTLSKLDFFKKKPLNTEKQTDDVSYGVQVQQRDPCVGSGICISSPEGGKPQRNRWRENISRLLWKRLGDLLEEPLHVFRELWIF